MKITKRKIFSVIVVLVIVSTVLTGCQSDPVADDIINYMNTEMQPVNELQESLVASLGIISENKNEEIATLISNFQDEVLPKLNNLIEEAKTIVPETEEVAAIHNKYIAAMIKQKNGFVKMIEGYKDNLNNETLDEGGVMIDEAGTEYTAYVEELNALAIEHDLELE